jgi:hypothetical protein
VAINHFDVVAIGIEDVGGVVAGVVSSGRGALVVGLGRRVRLAPSGARELAVEAERDLVRDLGAGKLLQ